MVMQSIRVEAVAQSRFENMGEYGAQAVGEEPLHRKKIRHWAKTYITMKTFAMMKSGVVPVPVMPAGGALD